MKIIIDLVECSDNTISVVCIHEIGKIRGLWKSEIIPLPGEKYNIELSLPSLGNNDVTILREKESFCYTTVNENGKVFFQGKCEQIDDVYIIRFADDWIEMLDIRSNSIVINDMVQFSINYKTIELFPY